MNNPFEHSSSTWVRYNSYEWRTDKNGVLYISPADDAKLKIYDPLENPDELILDVISTGMACMKKDVEAEKKAIMDFVCKYGLVGMMTALPTTPKFIDYEAVYLPKNRYIRAESLSTEDYLAYFFPFEKPDFWKRDEESSWEITDKQMMALVLTLGNRPESQLMGFQKNYAERYNWLYTLFKDWAFMVLTTFLYYEDRESLEDAQTGVYHKAMASFDGNAPSYHIELHDQPVLVWDFHSLLLGIQMMLAFALTDESKPLHLCRHCMKPFFAKRKDSRYCSPKCRNLAKSGEDK